MIFSHVIEGGRRSRFSIMFFGKPPRVIRELLQANGFRWRSGYWYRRSIAGAGEFLQQLDRALHPERPDGPCARCQSPRGFRRPQGSVCPILCGQCSGISDPLPLLEEGHREDPNPDPVDPLYEEGCARVCGPSRDG